MGDHLACTHRGDNCRSNAVAPIHHRSAELRRFRRQVQASVVAQHLAEQLPASLRAKRNPSYLAVYADFFFAVAQRRDIDSGLKALLDALCAPLGLNDNRVSEGAHQLEWLRHGCGAVPKQHIVLGRDGHRPQAALCKGLGAIPRPREGSIPQAAPRRQNALARSALV
ncbi:MAG: hypothetical protein WCI67_05120 [Chloroflexales bacterium]